MKSERNDNMRTALMKHRM